MARGQAKSKPERAHSAPGRAKTNTARAKPKSATATAPATGRPEQPGKSEPQGKKGGGLPVPDTPVSVPALPSPSVPPPPLPGGGKK